VSPLQEGSSQSCGPCAFLGRNFFSENLSGTLLSAGSTSRRFQNFSFSFRPLTYLHLPAHLSIMSSSSPRGQGGPKKSASEVQIRILKKRPLRFLRIPCLCGGKHRTSICPTEQTTTTTKTTNMVTPCGSTNFKIRKGKQQGRVPSTKRRWSEFRRQAQRRKISVDMTERHYMTLIKQPCGYCGKRQGRIGVDRVCNDQHYTTANTIACCAVCNFMKRDLGVRAFVHAAQAITTGPMASHFPLLLGPVPCRSSFLFTTTKVPTCNRPASR